MARKKKMTDAEVDAAARFVATALAKGATVTIHHSPCPKCGGFEPYRPSGTPNWMNRFTCPKCGRHESR